MADKPLFSLDAEGRWRLAYDRQQWVVQRRTQQPRVKRLEGHAIADSGWRGVSFVGSEKRVLRRVLAEKGVILTVEAQARLDALPDQFLAFLAAIDSPRPDNARSCATRPSDGPEHPQERDEPSAGVINPQTPEAARVG